MELSESIYEGYGAPYQKKRTRADANRASVRKKQGGELASPTGSAKDRANKRRNKYVDRSKSDNPDTPSCMIHGDGNSFV